MRPVGLQAIASYLPERWMTAAEIGVAAGIPEGVIVEKFGLRGKHIAATDEHVSDLAVTAAVIHRSGRYEAVACRPTDLNARPRGHSG